MTLLSVNVNKLATLRNSRGKNNPDVVKGALDILRFGAQGITVHPRPDERHIRRKDVYALKAALDHYNVEGPENVGRAHIELNIEGYPSEDFLKMVEEVQPGQCTLVPDPPDAITSNAGWKVAKNQELLSRVAERLTNAEVRSSVFVDPFDMEDGEYELLKDIGVDRIELYTERFAETFGTPEGVKVLARYKRASELARDAGLGINAGHDLSLENLSGLIQEIPWIAEVSIGHALVCDALYLGLEETVKRYLGCIWKGIEANRVPASRQ